LKVRGGCPKAPHGVAPPGKPLWPEAPSARVVVSLMAKEDKSEMREIVRRHLDNKGYVIRFTTHREGDNLVGRLHVTDAATEETVTKIVAVGKVDGIELVWGLDASGGVVRDAINQVLKLAEFLKFLVPEVSLKEE